jgi:hypothetical protein
VAYKRNAAASIPGAPKQGPEARAKRLTEELDEWLQNDQSGLSLSEARMLAMVGQPGAELPAALAASDEDRLEAALEAAFDDDD